MSPEHNDAPVEFTSDETVVALDTIRAMHEATRHLTHRDFSVASGFSPNSEDIRAIWLEAARREAPWAFGGKSI